MRLCADHASTPDEVDPLLRTVTGGRVSRGRAEIVETELVQQPDLDVLGRRVQVAGDQDGRCVADLADDRAHLFLPHERPI